ncbi:glycerol-3-phosphate dehydrogenase [Pseudonocardia sediminis]|uniref:Glycerol-3-phosphate dehydrogenase n=1 Tax=Pseudonocardia sediminis TaxID=1397368 RepID=A0A4Q7UWL6_PSEST|nr:glycerol-3-phosphate dehydrogenase/oxidase [Pseudonocardia sediminis]RZT84489.1 glycerol-3-phosphate dehydrogenase [Pseudonocardia sediminis]
MKSVALSPQARTGALRAMGSGELDVLVVGGGVVGSGAALDAATRGLSVGLVDARDFASGTSSRSSKLIHGGLRYLEMLDFRLVAEALQERGLLIQHLAPHLVRPVPFVYPLKHHVWERFYAGAGVALYDTLGLLSGRSRGLPHHRHLTRAGARRVVPSLRKDALVGALEYYDAQVDDARHTMMIARTAAAYGAHVATRARVVGLLKDSGRVVGATVQDLESGERIDVRAKQVINATGVWTDETQGLANERGQFKVRASKGIHLVVPRDRIRGDAGLILRTEKSVLFVIPWGRHWIIGTTDTDWDLDKAHPAASAADIEYLLKHVNGVLEQPLTHEDVEGVYAGLRPLLSGESEATSKLSREHAVATPVPGLVVVAGGKYTTYRVMAKDAVDAAVHSLDAKVPESCTEDVPLLGAEGYSALRNSTQLLAARSGLHPARIEHLLGRYGSLIDEVLDLLVEDPTLAEPLTGADDYLRAEAVYGASHEGARHLEDLLARRTRISIETFDRGEGAAEEVARLVAPVLGWDDEQIAREVDHYRKRVQAERESQKMPDDATADAARLGAPDVVPVSG